MGTKSKPADVFPLPATIAGLHERIAELTGDAAVIWADLADEARRESMPAAQYRLWASKARRAHAYKVAELKYLKAHLVRLELQRQETTRAAKAARQAERLARQAAQLAALENASLEAKLIRRLYGAVTRLYRDTREPVTERDRELMDTVHAYLVTTGMFDE